MSLDPATSTPSPPSPSSFLSHLISLVESEQLAEETQSSLLLSETPLPILLRAGLALTNLSPSNFSIGGFGGKTLVELGRNEAWSSGKRFEPHDFRVGDLARVRNGKGASSGAASTGKGKRAAKGKGKDKDQGDEDGIDAVVYKVGNEKITLVLDGEKNDSEEGGFEWSDKITILKVTNPSTFTRQIHFLRQAIRTCERSYPPKTVDQAVPTPATSSESPTAEPQSQNVEEESTTTSSTRSPSPTETPASDPPPLPPLLSVLLGLSSPTLSDESSLSVPNLSFYDPTLNSSQKEAVSFALLSNEVASIWGPPGTGKTQTLIEIIRQLVLSQGLRVLVCGASNLSVDNILLRLSAPNDLDIPPIKTTRLGHPARILNSLTNHTLDSQSLATDSNSLVQDIKDDLLSLENSLANRDKKTRIRGNERKKKWDEVRELRKDMRKRLNGITREVLGDKKVVMGTTHGVGGRVLDRMQDFDVVIIDEAAQATEPACWIPIMRGKKLILAGDHLQLPPTLKSLDPSSSSSSSSALQPLGPSPLRLSSTLETTLFSRLLSLHGTKIRKMLKIQYRFNEKINEFPSRMLYDSELVASENVRDRKLEDLLMDSEEGEKEVEGGDLEDLNEPIVFFDTAGLAMYERSSEEGGYGSESKSNENEADIVLNYVQFLIASKIPPSSISLISPYSSQVLLLSQTISPLYPEIEIGSIDSNQGRENDVVIISLVRSNETGEIGFLKEMRRLNVAMTRPRRQLVVVGDSETLKKKAVEIKRDKAKKLQKDKNGKNGNGNGKGKGKEVDQNGSENLEAKDKEREEASGDNDASSTSDADDDSSEEEDATKEGETESAGPNSTNQKRRHKKVTGARYLKEWIEYLEENAYVRVP
ncbi:hypothetical protein JCM16303_004840 [Sporobolomyces ruberrimus]